MVLRYKDIHVLCKIMYRAGEVSVHRVYYERATQPYSLGGRGTIYPDSRPADVTTRSPKIVAECLLTRAMLIKMYYLPWYVHVYVQLYLQSVNFMQTFT